MRPLKWAISKLDPSTSISMAPPTSSKMWSPRLASSFTHADDRSTTGTEPDALDSLTTMRQRRAKRRDSAAVAASMANADVILVTDGELPMPPVSEDVSSALRTLAEERGLRVHGLLVGEWKVRFLEGHFDVSPKKYI